MVAVEGLPHHVLLSPQGRDCTVPVNTCIQNPCLHGGTCHLSDTHKGGFR